MRRHFAGGTTTTVRRMCNKSVGNSMPAIQAHRRPIARNGRLATDARHLVDGGNIAAPKHRAGPER